MASIRLRPEMRTTGGEVSDILVNGCFAGTITLVYRDGDRVSGSVQLEKRSLPEGGKQQVEAFVQQYIQDTIHSLRATSCEVIVTYSLYDHIVSTDDYDYDWVDDDFYAGDEAAEDRDRFEMQSDGTELSGERFEEPVYYELAVTGEGRSRIEYGVFNKKKETIALVEAVVASHEVDGEIRWAFEPTEIEIDHVTELLVSDFDENEIDIFVINHWFDGEIIETVDLMHDDLIDDAAMTGELAEDPDFPETDYSADDYDDEMYTVVLGRDDGDTLTYEIYEQSKGGLPIGTATVDISSRQLSGFIDFRELDARKDHERIAAQLLRELDKEKEYQSISLTMLYHNKPFDEILFETEQLH